MHGFVEHTYPMYCCMYPMYPMYCMYVRYPNVGTTLCLPRQRKSSLSPWLHVQQGKSYTEQAPKTCEISSVPPQKHNDLSNVLTQRQSRWQMTGCMFRATPIITDRVGQHFVVHSSSQKQKRRSNKRKKKLFRHKSRWGFSSV